jgi:hypothetical protein
MTFQPTQSPHQLPPGVLYCGDRDCAYCKQLRATRFRDPDQLFLLPKPILIPKKRNLTLVNLIFYICGLIVVLVFLAAMASSIYLSWK